MHEWLSGGVSPCQGEGRGFESRLVLLNIRMIDPDFFDFTKKFGNLFETEHSAASGLKGREDGFEGYKPGQEILEKTDSI